MTFFVPIDIAYTITFIQLLALGRKCIQESLLTLLSLQLKSNLQKPHEKPLKTPSNSKSKKSSNKTFCMHERNLPMGSIKPWLKEGSHYLPLEVLTMEKGLEKKMVPAGIP